ncbi:MAG: CPBP family intramembrane metalloprotease [Saprospiraceae bacterium]|nr:CPBP family intramembrane metalloprotease [Saprospiraceae bacterium]
MVDNTNKYSLFFTNLSSTLRTNLKLQIGFFVLIWVIFSAIGVFLGRKIAAFSGVNDLDGLLSGLDQEALLEHINTLKVIIIVTNLFQYLLPVLAFSFLVFKSAAFVSLSASTKPRLTAVIQGVMMVLLIYPFVSFVYYWNTYLLPPDLISQETLDLQNLFLDMKSPIDFYLNLILLGFVAGVGEEFFFRGVLQRFFSELTKSIHLGAVLTGFAFSFMHFQLEGFIPRFILGVLFSYLLVYTANLWITVIIHVMFNSIQVLIPYFYPDLFSNINEVKEVSPAIAIVSLLVFAVFFIIFKRNNPIEYLKELDLNQ